MIEIRAAGAADAETLARLRAASPIEQRLRLGFVDDPVGVMSLA